MSEIKSEYKKKPHQVSELSKLDALLHKTCIKVLRLDMCTSMISLSKIAHQIWHNHPFSHDEQGNIMSSEGEGWEKWRRGSWTEFEKWGVANIGEVFVK